MSLRSLNMICLGCNFFGIHSSWCSLSFLGSVVWFYYLFWKILCHYYFIYFFYPFVFFFPSDIPIMCMLYFCSCPTGLEYSVLFLCSFFFVFAFQFWKFTDSLLSHVPSWLMSLSNALFICFDDFDV